jgi:hypothetical protein
MKALLFTTTTCAKCPAFKAFVSERVHLPVEVLNEKDARFGELAIHYGVTAAPTLVVIDEQEKEIFQASEQYEVQEAIDKGLLQNP